MEVLPDLKTQVYGIYQDAHWDSFGIDAWLGRNAWLFHAGYMSDGDEESFFRLGIGLRL
ncbi:MAG: hypothetical protein GX341_02510 [Firmicutes bacterium]|jgi:hypothetical protein|nr:hypothetical protein [Bacillota bacterium]